MTKIGLVLLIVFSMAACSTVNTVNLNSKYVGVNWKQVLVAPLAGNSGPEFEARFAYKFAIDSRFSFVPSNVVSVKLKNNNLHDKFLSDPYSAMLALAEAEKADAFVLGSAEVNVTQGSMDTVISKATARAELYSVSTGLVVATEMEEATSVFSSSSSTLNAAISAVLEGYEDIFDELFEQ